MSEENEGIPVTKICDRFSKSTVAYYKNRKARARLANKEDFILLLARRERMVNPMAGCKKVLLAIRPEMSKEGVSMGVNKFYSLMRRNGMLVPKRKKYRCFFGSEQIQFHLCQRFPFIVKRNRALLLHCIYQIFNSFDLS